MSHLHEDVVLDQLRQPHLKPLIHLTPSQIYRIMECESLVVPFHIPSVLLHALRVVLFDASTTTPYRDLIQYPMVSLLNDEHLSILANFYNLLLSSYKVETLQYGDCILLPKKSSHGVVANGRPLSNLLVLLKLFSMVITKALQTWLVHHGRISCTRMAMQQSDSVVDFLHSFRLGSTKALGLHALGQCRPCVWIG